MFQQKRLSDFRRMSSWNHAQYICSILECSKFIQWQYINNANGDAGIYTCLASNSDGTGESDMTTLMVSGKVFLIW
jgi:hypothetical protein